MDIFFKLIALALVAAILCLLLNKGGKEMGAVLSLAACCMVILAAMTYLSSVVTFAEKLHNLGALDTGLMAILLKATGIGLLTELSALVCTDAGNASLAKAIQLLGTTVIAWVSLPLLSGLMDLITHILGEV